MKIKALKQFIKGCKDTDEFQHRDYHAPLGNPKESGWWILRKNKRIRFKRSKIIEL